MLSTQIPAQGPLSSSHSARTSARATPTVEDHATPRSVPDYDAEEIPDNNFGRLIRSLKAALGPNKGLSCKDIDIEHIKCLMEQYEARDDDWLKYALHDPSRPYTRNGIINLNGNANLLILCWSPGKGSAIHDHANAHCCMKILKGNLMESLYDMPQTEGQPLVCKKETVLKNQEVGYIADDIGLHKISNPDSEVSVSLHLYTPPYASMYGCSMYEAGNGKKHHVDMSKYYSWQGQVSQLTVNE
ncbi:cysteine dioxygenase [Yamadazyma tenuis]|uniref:cysteine dioxygenase n=1 Tax=Candida tenuis TaxID=2315449 RepID=UPI0027A21198|nr:cysteine dioxygenase [Yamadazyma tenuis]